MSPAAQSESSISNDKGPKKPRYLSRFLRSVIERTILDQGAHTDEYKTPVSRIRRVTRRGKITVSKASQRIIRINERPGTTAKSLILEFANVGSRPKKFILHALPAWRRDVIVVRSFAQS